MPNCPLRVIQWGREMGIKNCIATDGLRLYLTRMRRYSGDDLNIVEVWRLTIIFLRNKVAMSTSVGDYLYEDVYMRSWDLAKGINDMLGEGPRKRICLLCPGDVTHVISMWSCWMTGHVAVPLCPSRSQERLETIIQDSNCDLVIATADQINRVHTITKKHEESGNPTACKTWTGIWWL